MVKCNVKLDLMRESGTLKGILYPFAITRPLAVNKHWRFIKIVSYGVWFMAVGVGRRASKDRDSY
jgi:hypothetical protein